jgi:alpha-1,6-mannosyltransferase
VTPHLVDATLFYTPTSGGVRRYLLEKHAWLNRQSRVRHTLFVPGPRDSGAAGGIVEFGSPLLRAGYRCPLRLPALRACLRDLSPDFLEAGDPYLMAWQVATVADALAVPAVAFCHSDVIGLATGRCGRPAGRLASLYLRALYSRFQLVLAPSQTVAARLVDAGIERLVVQPLGVDPDTFTPACSDDQLRARLGLARGERLLVFAGRLAPEKNVPELLQMIDILGAPYHLLVIGGERAGRPLPRVTVLPYEREPGAMAAMLAACDALVHAGRQETFGLVALEAMACALPVVAYDAGALGELIDERVGRLAPPRGPTALAAAVESLFEDDVRACGRAARSRVLEQYTWDASFRRQMRRYATLLDQPTLLRDDAALSSA